MFQLIVYFLLITFIIFNLQSYASHQSRHDSAHQASLLALAAPRSQSSIFNLLKPACRHRRRHCRRQSRYQFQSLIRCQNQSLIRCQFQSQCRYCYCRCLIRCQSRCCYCPVRPSQAWRCPRWSVRPLRLSARQPSRAGWAPGYTQRPPPGCETARRASSSRVSS